jgi:hypothetical protein
MDTNRDMDNIVQTTNDKAIAMLVAGRIVGTTVELFRDKFNQQLKERGIDFYAYDTWNNLTHWYLFEKNEGTTEQEAIDDLREQIE